MAEKGVLDYLKSANRPYSANDIHGNLQSYAKKDVTKALETLVEKKQIITKAYGKQNIYFFNQDSFTDFKDGEMQEIEEKIKNLYNEHEKLSMDYNMKRAEVSRRKEIPPLTEIEKKLSDVQKEIKDLEEKIQTSGSVKVDSGKLKDCQNAHAKMKKEVNRRKRIAKDAFNVILEHYEGSKASLLEELDIDIS
ncbi:homologous-pairing protein 2 homolog [Tetranychus urticae]|uniref:Homologous-pairing protein 2 winged helix domain-containing protein n=1 Tax=Tetranychus urticae TaxID=32264 RepID=T1KZW4_TETUR|nr:homologous-pairing protein 2 homolog [Tetranychus urticae]XP_025018010.1 homologous-pairing protein 2 homolog [Tetranychus urticae]